MLKIGLLNNTSSELHYGCDLVTEEIERQCDLYDAKVLFRLKTGEDVSSLKEVIRQKPPEVIIVNGEGTLHHSQESALKIANCLNYLANLRIPFVIINATIQDNNNYITDTLGYAEQIYVRESFTKSHLSTMGIDAEITPDLSISALRKIFKEENGDAIIARNPIYTDSVCSKKTERIHLLSKGSMQYLSLHRFRRPFETEGFNNVYYFLSLLYYSLRYTFTLNFSALKKVAGYKKNLPDFIESVSNAEYIITGRYHMVCICIALRIPFVAVDSNTWKIRSMLIDCFGSDDRLESTKSISVDRKKPDNFNKLESDKMEIYSSLATIRTKRMFASILS